MADTVHKVSIICASCCVWNCGACCKYAFTIRITCSSSTEKPDVSRARLPVHCADVVQSLLRLDSQI